MTVYEYILNIGSLSTPVAGTGFIKVYPIADNLKFGKKRGGLIEEYYTYVATGNLVFYDDEYDAIKTLQATNAELDIKLYYGDPFVGFISPQVVGKLNLEGDYDDDSKRVSLSVSSNDQASLFEANITKEYNILNTTPIVDVVADLDVAVIKFYESSQSYSSIWKDPGQSHTYSTIDGSFSKDIWGREERRVGFVEKIATVGSNGWVQLTDYGDGTFLIVRNWTYYFDDPEISFPNQFLSTDDMFLLTDESPYFDSTLDYTINNELYIYDGINSTKINAVFLFNFNSGGIGNYFFAKKSYMGITQISYSRGRQFQDVLTDMVSNINPVGFAPIIVDGQTFAYLDANIDLENLLIQSLPDSIPSGGIEPTDPALICNLTFESVLRFLWEKPKITYTIDPINEDVSTFRLVHWTEKPSTTGTGANDLTTYNSIDWTEHNNKYTPNVDQNYYRRKRTGIYGGVDFIGKDILIPEFEKTFPVTVTYEDVDIYTDINDIAQKPGKYDENAETQAVLLACNITTPGNAVNAYSNTQNYESVQYFADTFEIRLLNDAGGTNLAIASSNSFNLDNVGDYVNIVVTGFSGFSPQLAATFIYLYNTSSGIAYGGYQVTSLPDVTLTVPSVPIGTYRIQFRTNFENGTTGRINHYVTIGNDTINDYQTRVTEGVLSGKSIVNAELSNANLDAGHGKYGFPHNEVTINDVTETINDDRVLKLKTINEKYALRDNTLLDFDKLFKTGQSAIIEADEIMIDANFGACEFKGRY